MNKKLPKPLSGCKDDKCINPDYYSVVEATTQVGGQGGGPGFNGTPAHIKPNFFKVTAGVIGPHITNGFGSNPNSVHSYPYDTNLVNNNC